MNQHGTKVPGAPYMQMAGFVQEAAPQKPWLLPNNAPLQVSTQNDVAGAVSPYWLLELYILATFNGY